MLMCSPCSCSLWSARWLSRVSFVGARIDLPEFVAAAWFGPKGFASVVYGLLVLESGVNLSEEMFSLIALVVTASILIHSSTDVVVARRFRGADLEAPIRTAFAKESPRETPRAELAAMMAGFSQLLSSSTLRVHISCQSRTSWFFKATLNVFRTNAVSFVAPLPPYRFLRP